jgi:hypothetical protein
MKTPSQIFYRLLFLLSFSVSSSFGGAALTGTLGGTLRSNLREAHFSYTVSGYYKFDEMTLFGIESGQGVYDNSKTVPILASTYIRFPLGRIILPVIKGEIGSTVNGPPSGFMWRGGGGFDCKNGKYSSLLFLGGFEKLGNVGAYFLRAGLLLEL